MLNARRIISPIFQNLGLCDSVSQSGCPGCHIRCTQKLFSRAVRFCAADSHGPCDDGRCDGSDIKKSLYLIGEGVSVRARACFRGRSPAVDLSRYGDSPVATLAADTRDYVVADISLADFGRTETNIAETEMPGLMALRSESGATPPPKGARQMGKASWRE